MRKQIIAGLATTLSLVSLPAFSADNGIYLGGSIGQSVSNVEGERQLHDACGERHQQHTHEQELHDGRARLVAHVSAT
jgi:hypothetical protein